MKSEFLPSQGNFFKMRCSCTWILENERVPRWGLFDHIIVAPLTYQVEMKWNQKSPLNLKISGCLHRVPGGRGSAFWNIFWSNYRTSIIFFMAQRTRLKTPFTYLEHYHIANRKFFRALWKKIWRQKRRIYQKFPAQFLLHFWDHRICHFSFNITRSVHRMVPIFFTGVKS